MQESTSISNSGSSRPCGTLRACRNFLDLLACPHCGQSFDLVEDDLLRCSHGHGFPIFFGIPDLRLFDAPYHSLEQELEVAGRVAERAERSSYPELAAWYYASDESEGYTERSDVGVRWALAMKERSREILEEVDRFIDDAGHEPRHGVALEVGCGGGGALEALARGHERVIGVNISLAELILARRFLFDNGVDNVLLVAACSEGLPIQDGCVGFGLMEDTIEHVTDQRAALSEAVRCLAPGGLLHFNSPNRYALLSPEGHVKLMWVGFLPRPLMDPYVRMRTGRPYHQIRLLGWAELTDLLDSLSPGARYLVFTPKLRQEASSMLGRAYRTVAQLSEPAADLAYLGLQPEFKVLVAPEGTA